MTVDAAGDNHTLGSSPAERLDVTPAAVVNWAVAIETVEALARSAEGSAVAIIEPVARRLLAPLVRIEELAEFARRALSGDQRATQDLADLTCALEETRPWSTGMFSQLLRPTQAQTGCCGDQYEDIDPSVAEASDTMQVRALDRGDVLDEATLVETTLSIAGVAAANPTFLRRRALDALATSVLEAGPIVQTARAYRAAGTPGLLNEFGSLVSTQQLMIGPSFGNTADLLFDFNPNPDLDLGGSLLGGFKPMRDLIRELRRPKGIDRDYWRPFTPFERQPLEFFPPGWLSLLGCLRAVAQRIDARAAIPPPAPPARAVWIDGITSIEQSGACQGDEIRIRGKGFNAIKGKAVLLLPSETGCRPVDVAPADWTDTLIKATIPAGATSGPVGFADASYVAAYRDWVGEQDRLADEIRKFSCYLLARPISIAPPFPMCPPNAVFNRLRAGTAVIKAFTVNGLPTMVVEPGTPLQLNWTVDNTESITLSRSGSHGPGFGGASSITNPAGQNYVLGPFNGDSPVSEMYTLTATGPCGNATATVTVRLGRIPTLRIIGAEVTQGIQKFRSPDGADNSIPVVAGKDTVVRVYVAADNLNHFNVKFNLGGELQAGGFWFAPANVAETQVEGPALRSRTVNSLNFKLPASVCTGTKTIRIRAWVREELDAPITGEKVRPMSPYFEHNTTWVDKRPFKVRYVRISQPGFPALSDQAARDVVTRAFDLLPTPPSDIAPARLATWHTGQNLSTRDGTSTLLGHIDDQHDCTFSESIFPWEDECPDDDGAVWIAVTPRSEYGGMAEPWQPFDTSRNTVVTPPEHVVAAHELAHTRKLNHVNVGSFPEDQRTFDPMPDGGQIRMEDAFDPHDMKLISESGPGFGGVYDFMSYAQAPRWVSATNWNRLLTKF
jgi:hypothetical protein